MTASTLFVAGAHTEIGKTYVGCALARAARAAGLSVEVLKPVVSGFEPSAWEGSDPGRLLAATGVALTPVNLDRISPWRFAAPLAPPAAARLEERALPFPAIAEWARRRMAEATADLLLVEGVGGLMSPIADGATSLDLLLEVLGPVVLVTGTYLGAVSHALCAAEVLRTRGRPPVAVVVSERGAPDDIGLEATAALLREHLGAIPVHLARHNEQGWAGSVLRAALAAGVTAAD